MAASSETHRVVKKCSEGRCSAARQGGAGWCGAEEGQTLVIKVTLAQSPPGLLGRLKRPWQEQAWEKFLALGILGTQNPFNSLKAIKKCV